MSLYPRKKIGKQRGLVMIMVVGVVVLMISLLALLLEEQHILIRQVGNQKVAEQSHHYAQGINEWAMRVLQDDANRLIDHNKEKWAKFGRPDEEPLESDEFSLTVESQISEEDEDEATIDFGIDTIEYSIDDLQARYNLNNLVAKKQPVAEQKRIFINLLEILEIGDFDTREKMYGALVDWLDENDTQFPNGFESGDYRIKATPYQAADQQLTGLGELRFVEGFSKDTIKALKPYVVILPVETARMNINTATPQVLAALSTAPVNDIGSVQTFLARRMEPGFQGFQANDINALENAIVGVSAVRQAPIKNMMQVNSQFFQINAKVSLGDYVICTRTVVLRQSANAEQQNSKQKISVLRREQDTLCQSQESDTESAIDEDLS